MESRFTTSRGTSLYVEDIGSGPAILAVHGLGGGAYFFRGLAERLRDRYRVLSVDLPGTGRSVVTGEFSLDTWVDDLGDLIDERVGLPTVFLGHSMGTIIGLKAWDSWPDWIRAFVFVGGLPQVRAVVRERLTERMESVAKHGLAGWGEKVMPGIFAPATMASSPEVVGLFERLFEAQHPATYVRCTKILLEASAVWTVPTVRVPCLALTGRHDQYAPPDAVNAFAKRLPGEWREEVMEDCGHMPFFEAPDAFAKAVRTFLEEL